ncbi:hypothetical protein [Candidatus Mycoplasma haematominutum]|uniref:Uncharacterized protein n=1 Tax=Candidatus Mycoplasma haematominutum 'Birmingham 1' TaxID=1116213 RepID=G8C3D7_9MOLU|nr:hypothetical protein [Candidatus Mycoplasma haematominutum]CCE66835.1 hypothetical protein MHM_03170 [Candidatus Mycoplasma haematominutum 'Birmingham 1']
MFYLSRLLLGGGTLASSGGLSAYFIPSLTSMGESTIFSGEESRDRDLNFQRLESHAAETTAALTKLISDFQKSKTFTASAKENKHKKSLELMAQLATSEEALQKLYKHMEEKLKNLQQESQTLSATIEEKLGLDAQFQQIKVSQGTLNQLVERLKQWETQLNTVICVFKQQGQEDGQQDCNRTSSTLLSSVLSSANSSEGGASEQTAVQNGGASTEGEKAKQTLAAAQKVFQSLQQSVSQANLQVQQEAMKLIWEELKRYPEWLKLQSKIQLVETHIQLINRTIQKTSESAATKTEELNSQNQELKVTYDKYETLKKWESSFHSFIAQFQHKMRELKGDSTNSVTLSEG